MADDTVTEATETTETTEHDGSTDERLTRVENAVERIEQAVSALVPSHQQAQQHTERRLDRASTVAEQVQAVLDQRERQAAEQQAADAKRAEEESLKERLARLEERPPAPPRLRRTRILGWGDGRS